jgi:adenylate kinase
MSRVVLITGPNGVGKSRVITEITSRSVRPVHFEHFHGSSQLMHWCGVTTREQLRELPDDHKREVENRGMHELIHEHHATGNGTTLLVDAHLVHCQDGIARPNEQPWMRMVDAIVTLTSRPTLIHNRLRRDAVETGRSRDCLPFELAYAERIAAIRQFLDESARLGRDFAALWDIPWALVYNLGRTPAPAVRAVRAFLDGVPLAREQPVPSLAPIAARLH